MGYKKILLGLLISLSSIIVLSGCAAVSKHEDDAIVSQFRIGKTTPAQVEQVLGAPNSRNKTKMGKNLIETWMYYSLLPDKNSMLMGLATSYATSIVPMGNAALMVNQAGNTAAASMATNKKGLTMQFTNGVLTSIDK